MPSLVFYNSYSKALEPFEPKEPGKARVYHCGPTVYKRQHIGNMRRYVFADVLRRTLELWGYEVREIMNITDVGHLTEDELDEGEDKLAKEARLEQKSPLEIADREIKNFENDLQALNIQPAHKYPRATNHIQAMQELIQQLLDRGKAYQTETGIYFDVTTFPDYGKLSGNSVAQLEAGKRISVRAEKRHPADFALWIFDKQATQKWDSPWGVGYPGWHIECSAMSMEYLDTEIDIHTGGIDNKFPHHENEIAQAEGATGQKFVRVWMHNAHLRMGGEKMAKSSGATINLDTVREQGYSPLALRLLILGSHYRTPMEFDWDLMKQAQEQLETIKQVWRRLDGQNETGAIDQKVKDDFQAALADDLNTPAALAVFWGFIKEVNKKLEENKLTGNEAATLLMMDRVLGIQEPLRTELSQEEVPLEVVKLQAERETARREKKWERADELRIKMEELGYTVEDTNTGSRVRPIK